MAGIFFPVRTGLIGSEGEDEIQLRVNLDPHQPYLDHHRPGGVPLLGTVMGIEAMAAAVTTIAPARSVISVEGLRVFSPFILDGNSATAIEVRIRPASSDHANLRFACAVLSSRKSGEETLHFAAGLKTGARRFGESRVNKDECKTLKGMNVSGQDVYACFFHGPSFQVVAGAAWREGTMIARLSSQMPCSHEPAETATAIAPRLMELALQTSGLLELAMSGQMRIPDQIGRIVRYSDIEAHDLIPLFAVARPVPGIANQPNSHNIEIVNEEGLVHLRVETYRTVPLPFAQDDAAIDRLIRLLRAPAI